MALKKKTQSKSTGKKKKEQAEAQKQAQKSLNIFDDMFSQVDTDNMDLDAVDVNSDLINVPTLPMQETVTTKKKTAKPGVEKESENRIDSQDGSSEQMVIPNELGILALRNVVVFPGTVSPLAVGRPRSQQLLEALANNKIYPGSGKKLPPQSEKLIGVLTQKQANVDKPGYEDLYPTGTVVSILRQLKLPDGHNSLVVHGLVRFRVVEWLGNEPYLRARIEVLTSQAEPSKTLDALVTSIRQMAEQMIELSPNVPDEVQVVLHNIEEPGTLADFLAANLNMPVEKKQDLLETIDVTERLQKLSVALAAQLELLELSAKIQSKVSKSIDKNQREYYLQEQLKAIQTELGQADQRSVEIGELREQIAEAEMPEAVQAEAEKELERLARIPTMSPEFSVLRTYIEWLCELPWSKQTAEKLNLPTAKRILNRDHYDLAKVKKRILEFLAVRKLNPRGRSPILCFAGPPGVGKTSLGKSIAAAMGRKFTRISLGGIRDEADIRGHRRTYIGALPGRIMQELRKCKSNNPVFMLDELDKVGNDFRGDPASALLEVLDPEQNNTFTDHYIDQPFDLSNVMFIATANYMGQVPPALRDRMEVIELPGYTSNEKLAIAQRYLVPRQLAENGLKKSQLNIKQDALEEVISSYTRESGVRELERKIAGICRAVAVDIASNKCKSATISDGKLHKLIGPILYESELALRTSTPGVATGLAYTPVGGEILFIETTITPGSGKVLLTGQLGDVMKESAQAALSVLKNHVLSGKKFEASMDKAELDAAIKRISELEKQDLHIHVPAGAVPKDGPSAGLAIYSALSSLMLEKPIRADIAMTGEITLRGLVMPIGGVKEKVLAAKQAGIKTVILPERNKKDLEELARDVRQGLKFHFVREVDKALGIMLENGKSPKKTNKRKTR